jgi:hypothetical protein
VLTVANAQDLTTLADVKAWLTIGSSDATFDDMLTRLITACSMYMQAYMSRIIAVSTYSKVFNGDGKYQKMLPVSPIQTVTGLTINGVTIPAGTYPANGAQSTGYFFDEDTIYLHGYCFLRGVQNCSVSLTAGMPSSDPNVFALAQGCIETVGKVFRERGRIGEVSKSVNGEVITFSQKDFPEDVMTLMNQLRNITPVSW